MNEDEFLWETSVMDQTIEITRRSPERKFWNVRIFNPNSGAYIILDPKQIKDLLEALGSDRFPELAVMADSDTKLLQADPVNHPSHYTQYKGVEVIDLTEQMNFNRGNAVKYLCRAGFKGSDTELEDLNKARWYLDREIERISRGF